MTYDCFVYSDAPHHGNFGGGEEVIMRQNGAGETPGPLFLVTLCAKVCAKA